jgi:hypothetical protein
MYLQVNLLGPGPRLLKKYLSSYEKSIYRAVVSQRLSSTDVEDDY